MLPFLKRIIRTWRGRETHDDLVIVKVLELSTAHLTEEAGTDLYSHYRIGVHQTRYGWRVSVPEDGRICEWAKRDGDVPDELGAIFALADARGSEYVLFDRDADVTNLLPAFDW